MQSVCWSKAKEWFIYVMCCVIIGGSSYLIFFRACTTPGTDYYFHTQWIKSISIHHIDTFFETYQVYYPLWHFIVFFVYRIGIELPVAAATVSAICNVVTYCIVKKYIFQVANSEVGASIFSAIVMFLQPVWLGFDYALLVGHCSPNEWRNPTTLIARLVGMVVVFRIFKILKCARNNGKTFLILAGELIISALAKPSFLQAFIPGLGLYMVLSFWKSGEKKKLVTLYGKIILAHIPAVLVLMGQMLLTFGNSAGFDITWMEYWSRYTPNLAVSLLAAYAFPIYVLFVYYKNMKQQEPIRVVLSLQTIALLEAALFVERGARRLHGNFVWANSIIMFVLYLLCLHAFMKCCERRNNKWDYVRMIGGYAILAIQLCSGIWWIVKYLI